MSRDLARHARSRSAPTGTAAARTSRSSPSTPSTSSSACSTTRATRRGWRCPAAGRRTTTATSPGSARASATASGSTARTRPHEGHRFNPAKLLIDPYAKAIEGEVDWAHDANVLPYVPTGDEDADLELDDEDDAAAMPKSIVIDDAFLWEGDRLPRIPFADTVIYETHVKGFTMTHPEVREDLRGTYAGLASEPAIAYLKDLGVTAVELLPVHHISERVASSPSAG